MRNLVETRYYRLIANDKVLFALVFAAPDLCRRQAASFRCKSVCIPRQDYSERQNSFDVHYSLLVLDHRSSMIGHTIDYYLCIYILTWSNRI